MSHYITPHMLGAQAPVTGPGALRRFGAAIVRNWRRCRMIAAFEAMDDRLLGDIGIERADIPRIVDRLDDRELRMVPVTHLDATRRQYALAA